MGDSFFAIPANIIDARECARIIESGRARFGAMVLPGIAPYGPSKAAAEAATSIMAKDLAGTGVTANVLIPGGAADTRMVTDDRSFPDRTKLVQPAKSWRHWCGSPPTIRMA
jgi:NAD(P)-dependent dehydrogenase (short-subunit alcohol dehydrogenase family)